MADIKDQVAKNTCRVCAGVVLVCSHLRQSWEFIYCIKIANKIMLHVFDVNISRFYYIFRTLYIQETLSLDVL